MERGGGVGVAAAAAPSPALRLQPRLQQARESGMGGWRAGLTRAPRPGPEITVAPKSSQPEWMRKKEIEIEKKPGPLWRRKIEQETKTVPEMKIEPIWKRKPVSDKKMEPLLKSTQDSEKKLEPLWKRKFESNPPEPTKNVMTWRRKPRDIETSKDGQPKSKDTPQVKAGQAAKGEERGAGGRGIGRDRKEETENNEKEEEKKKEEEEEEEGEELLCPYCSQMYDAEVEDLRPVQLPRCGHSFCRGCLLKVKKKGHFPCPTCRKRHLKPPVETLPDHTQLLDRVEAFRIEKVGRCARHGEPRVFWCCDCSRGLCGSCRVEDGHKVLRTRVVLGEKREEARRCGGEVMDTVDRHKSAILSSVVGCSAQLLKACADSEVAADSAQDVKEMLSEAKRTGDLPSLLASLKRMKSLLGGLVGRPAGEEEEGSGTPKEKRRWGRRHRSQDAAPGEREARAAQGEAGAQGRGAPGAQQRVLSPGRRGEVSYSQLMGGSGMTGGQRAQVRSEGPLAEAPLALWPLTCCVFQQDGRRASLAWQDGRLLMAALAPDLPDAHFMIKLSVVQGVVPREEPEVFLELAAGPEVLGRVYIRLWGHLRRAQHFLALCMGTHGPSYRGAKFEEVFSRGLLGECLHAGPYITPEGGLSAQGVMDNLEWDGKFKKPQRKGMVVGAGSGRPDRDSCFDICTIENPRRDFACPFGEVVGGWDVVLAARDHRPIRAVTMVDVGVVLPANPLQHSITPTESSPTEPSPSTPTAH